MKGDKRQLDSDAGTRSLSRNGVRLVYTDVGQGDPPIVLIHGWCCDRTHWENQVQALSVDHRVIAVDLRGHGDSDKPDQDYDMKGFVSDTLWVLDQLGFTSPPVLMGHSMGGVIALQMIRERPDAFSGAVFVDSTLVPLSPDSRAVWDQLIAMLKAGDPVAWDLIGPAMFSGGDQTKALQDSVVARMKLAPQRLQHSAIEDHFLESSLPAGLLPIPALAIQAGLNTERHAALAQRYPGLTVTGVASGHFVQLESPLELNAHVAAFLKELQIASPIVIAATSPELGTT